MHSVCPFDNFILLDLSYMTVTAALSDKSLFGCLFGVGFFVIANYNCCIQNVLAGILVVNA